jgi:hypothetical protein
MDDGDMGRERQLWEIHPLGRRWREIVCAAYMPVVSHLEEPLGQWGVGARIGQLWELNLGRSKGIGRHCQYV